MRSLVLCAALLTAPLMAAGLPTVAVAATPVSDAAGAEAVLRQTITDFQAGKPDYTTMAPELAAAVKPQEATMAQLAPLGPITAVARTGESDAPYMFAVTFQVGVTLNWSISFDEAGIITGIFVTQ